MRWLDMRWQQVWAMMGFWGELGSRLFVRMVDKILHGILETVRPARRVAEYGDAFLAGKRGSRLRRRVGWAWDGHDI